jgi:hypothetical protein
MSFQHRSHQSEPKLTGLVARVLGPVGPEVSCEECFELLDQYVDLEAAGADAAAALPGVTAHLAGCPACHEDHESLHALVAGTDDGAPPAPR